ncbi:hypothetical protein MNBD_GAMMA10-540 [hydrothermal vent metagenome]|uniref:Uncharacterized protein n=1 Tax=hydrothermal vent metagenome TaxID=652676 RepID=A0A3B0Y8H8_9ZZZZ
MKIEHSDLLHEFITFWFETRIDSKLTYETFLNYSEMTWETREINKPYTSVLAGIIEKTGNEKTEEQKIRDFITGHIQNR